MLRYYLFLILVPIPVLSTQFCVDFCSTVKITELEDEGCILSLDPLLVLDCK